MSSNLPPGVAPDMIPGNTPEDEEWERLHEQIDHDCSERDISVDEASIIWAFAIKSWEKMEGKRWIASVEKVADDNPER